MSFHPIPKEEAITKLGLFAMKTLVFCSGVSLNILTMFSRRQPTQNGLRGIFVDFCLMLSCLGISFVLLIICLYIRFLILCFNVCVYVPFKNYSDLFRLFVRFFPKERGKEGEAWLVGRGKDLKDLGKGEPK